MSKVFVSLGISLDGFPPAHANQRCTSAERSEQVDPTGVPGYVENTDANLPSDRRG
jgi:hypothetical protein